MCACEGDAADVAWRNIPMLGREGDRLNQFVLTSRARHRGKDDAWCVAGTRFNVGLKPIRAGADRLHRRIIETPVWGRTSYFRRTCLRGGRKPIYIRIRSAWTVEYNNKG
jgi:hypothetical protein